MNRLGESVTPNAKGFSYYLRSLAITAVMTFVLPLVLLGLALGLLTALPVICPAIAAAEQAAGHLQNFLVILGNGDAWQGALLIGTVSSLVGMLFDTYAFYRYQGVNHR